jgi:hypothetical protein
MKTTNSAADLLNVLCAMTQIIPLDVQRGINDRIAISPDEMRASDVGDAVDAWDFFWRSVPGQVTYLPDGRNVVRL